MYYVNIVSTTGQFRLFAGRSPGRDSLVGFPLSDSALFQFDLIREKYGIGNMAFELGIRDAMVVGPSIGLGIMALVRSVKAKQQLPDRFVFNGEIRKNGGIVLPGSLNEKAPYITEDQTLVTGDFYLNELTEVDGPPKTVYCPDIFDMLEYCFNVKQT